MRATSSRAPAARWSSRPGTATSTRVREQEQSFNTIDIADGSATITVNAWKGDASRPLDAQRYEWQDGRWRIAQAQSRRTELVAAAALD